MANNTKVNTKPKADNAEEIKVTQKEEQKPIVPKDIDPNMYVLVRNGFHGVLTYVSPRTGEETTWDNYGDDQEMELRELRNAKSAAKGFFTNNWFMFDEDWIIDYLGVGKFYKNAISPDSYDELFDKSAEELKKIISAMTPSQKRSMGYRASQLIHDGVIDSLKRINVIEDTLGIELIEK